MENRSEPLMKQSLNGFTSVMELMTRIPFQEWGWNPQPSLHSRRAWTNDEVRGIMFKLGEYSVTNAIADWFRNEGWRIEVSDSNVAIVAPFRFLKPSDPVYHCTLNVNVKSIRELGLLTGQIAGTSTTGRRDCAKSIYVTMDKVSSKNWVGDALLAKRHPHAQWAILKISPNGLSRPIFRDPASQTGYILEDKHVAADRLELLEVFTV
jgi:hypothetical protein